jgi:colicin import membrane protein
LRKHPGAWKAILYAVLVHVIVIGILVVSFRWSSDSGTAPEKIIDAKIVEEPPKQKRDEELARQQAAEAEQRRQAEAEKQRREETEKKRQAELVKKQEAERKRQVEAERKRQEEIKRQAELKRQEELKKQEELKRKKQEAERQKIAEDALQEQLIAEEQQRQEAARAERARQAGDQYKAAIRQKVSRNWSRPPGSQSGLQCVVRVRLVPGGEVLQATVVRSSGNRVFDRSVENAVFKASPLPLPGDPDLFDYFREIEFVFSPETSERIEP